MLRDSTPSRLYTASCFEDNDHTEDSTDENMMKQPLILSNKSLEDEEQTKLQNERQSRTVICKSFLLGSFIGFVLQVMTCAACYTLFKMFVSDPKPSTTPLLGTFSYCTLVLINQLDIAIYVAIWLTFMCTITKAGSLYMRKKFDKDVANPDAGSIWTTQTLYIVGVYFVFGFIAGSFCLWITVTLCTEMMIPLKPLFTLMMIDFVAFLFVVKCFDWSHAIAASEYTTKQKLEDDSYWIFIV
jgi:hypothetical protein